MVTELVMMGMMAIREMITSSANVITSAGPVIAVSPGTAIAVIPITPMLETRLTTAIVMPRVHDHPFPLRNAKPYAISNIPNRNTIVPRKSKIIAARPE